MGFGLGFFVCELVRFFFLGFFWGGGLQPFLECKYCVRQCFFLLRSTFWVGLGFFFFFKEKVEGGIKCKNFKTTADEKSVDYKAGVLFFLCVCVCFSFVCWASFCVCFIFFPLVAHWVLNLMTKYKTIGYLAEHITVSDLKTNPNNPETHRKPPTY